MTRLAAYLCVLLVLMLGCSQDSKQAKEESKTAETTVAKKPTRGRSFRFHYKFNVNGLEPGKQVRIWVPRPQSTQQQSIAVVEANLPGQPQFTRDSDYGNEILYLDVVAPENGQLSIDLPYDVKRFEVLTSESEPDNIINEAQKESFLKANSKVPIEGRPLDLLGDVKLSDDHFVAAKQLYDLVDAHVAYSKEGEGWGNGDVLWVCDSRTGNCTDFHSLFASLARSQGIPTRFEIGFPIPAEPEGKVGGYHCWAWSYIEDRGWIPVDISEADKHPEMKEYYFGGLTPDRVMFTIGRDIVLKPESAHGPLNYFVYPHIEVDGKTLPREQIDLEFSYAAIE